MNMPGSKLPPQGFTLIELLVVVSIITVLVSLLMPAMEAAVYEAKLARCAANNKGIATGTLSYTTDNRSFYPVRKTLAVGEPNLVAETRRLRC